MVRDDGDDLHAELAAAPAPDQLEQAVLLARREEHDALALARRRQPPAHLEPPRHAASSRASSSPRRAASSRWTSMRRKNAPPSGSVEYWSEVTMFTPDSASAVESAAMIPWRSAHDEKAHDGGRHCVTLRIVCSCVNRSVANHGNLSRDGGSRRSGERHRVVVPYGHARSSGYELVVLGRVRPRGQARPDRRLRRGRRRRGGSHRRVRRLRAAAAPRRPARRRLRQHRGRRVHRARDPDHDSARRRSPCDGVRRDRVPPRAGAPGWWRRTAAREKACGIAARSEQV